ncbi:MAG: CBS domain-containing protein [Dehalococcoidales bacterium]|nr:CBS domain-containing protein [Dehalococcoidales bacterium]
MKIKDLLKDRPVITIGPDATISQAVQKLVEHNRGSLPVIDSKGELVGIITERDIVRKCFARIDGCDNIKIRDVMTKEVVIGTLEDEADYAVMAMKEKRIRHLPIVENKKVVGMVSMRDLLDVQLANCKVEVRYSQLLPRRTQRPIV